MDPNTFIPDNEHRALIRDVERTQTTLKRKLDARNRKKTAGALVWGTIAGSAAAYRYSLFFGALVFAVTANVIAALLSYRDKIDEAEDEEVYELIVLIRASTPEDGKKLFAAWLEKRRTAFLTRP